MAVTQAIIQAAWREKRLQEQKWKVERLRRQYDRTVASKPSWQAKLSVRRSDPTPETKGTRTVPPLPSGAVDV